MRKNLWTALAVTAAAAIISAVPAATFFLSKSKQEKKSNFYASMKFVQI